MTTLITAVGDTDPIRGYHDGAILHICRGFRPEHVYLIFTEGMFHKEAEIKRAIYSIDANYRPIIKRASSLISNEDAVGFNTAYINVAKALNEFLEHYDSNEKIILNLSSATPGLKSAMFSISILEQLSYTAVQVLSPEKASNSHSKVEDITDFEGLSIEELTLDHGLLPEECFFANNPASGRIKIEKGEAVSHRISKQILEQMLDNYDYASVRAILLSQKAFEHQRLLLTKLDAILKDIHLQRIPDSLKKVSPFGLESKQENDRFRIAIQYFRRLKMQAKRREFADIILKSISLAVFLGQEFLTLNGEDRIEGYADLLYSVSSACFRCNEDNNLGQDAFMSSMAVFSPKINSLRNKIAHDLGTVSLGDISSNDFRGIEKLVEELTAALEVMISELYHLKDNSLFTYYDDLNRELINLL